MSWHLKIVLGIVKHLILAIFVVYGEWVNLVIVSAWHNEHPYCTYSDILLVLFLLTNVLIVSRFGQKHLLNALNVNVNNNLKSLSSC